MDICLKCLRGLHDICTDTVDNPCVCSHSLTVVTSVQLGEDSGSEESFDQYFEDGEQVLERAGKLDASLKDQYSTGRKRAAKLYPLNREAACEWRGIIKPGGSLYTIEDCGSGLQEVRHHGPDYNTLNNDPGNVHRICALHHNRWHAIMDGLKDESYLILYGHKPKKEHLSNAAKNLKSGS